MATVVVENEKQPVPGSGTGHHKLEAKPSQVSMRSTTSSLTDEKVMGASNGLSPPSQVYTNDSYDNDIEAMITHNTLAQLSTRQADGMDGPPNCHVWPGQRTWKLRAKESRKKQRRGCNCLAHLSKRNQIIVKILIGLLLVGIAVGVGIGISKSLGSSIWRSSSTYNASH